MLYFYFNDIQLSKYSVLGRTIHIFQAFVELAKKNRTLFVLAWAGIVSGAFRTAKLSLGLNWLIFSAVFLVGFFLWVRLAAALCVRYRMTWSTGLRDAAVFFLPFICFLAGGVPVSMLISAAGTGEALLIFYYLWKIGPKKQHDYMIPVPLEADVFLDTELPSGTRGKKLQCGAETRNAFVLKKGLPMILKVRHRSNRLLFAYAPSQEISSKPEPLDFNITWKREGGNDQTIFSKTFDPLKDFRARGWIDVQLPLDGLETGANTLTLSLKLTSSFAKEIYISEFRSPAPKAKPRKVILIFFDGLIPGHLGCYGYSKSASPFVDAFAKDAIRFEHAYTQGNWTLTSFMSTLTSLYPSQHGIYHPQKIRHLDNAIPTLPQILRNNGFVTRSFFTHKRLVPNYGFARGFDVHRHEQSDKPWARGTADQVTAHALDMLNFHRQDDLFLMLHYFDTHEPFLPPSPYTHRFDTAFSGRPFTRPQEVNKAALYKTESNEALRNMIAQLDSDLLKTDTRFGNLIHYLKSTGQYEDSLILVMADHGTRLKDPAKLLAYTLFDESIRVPFLLKLPGSQNSSGRVSEAMVAANLDVAPTVLSAFGIQADARMQGQNVASSRLSRSGVISESLYKNEYLVSIREHGFRYVYKQEMQGTDFGRLKEDTFQEFLYPVREGQDQTENVALEAKERCEEYRARVLRHLEASKSFKRDTF